MQRAATFVKGKMNLFDPEKFFKFRRETRLLKTPTLFKDGRDSDSL